MDSKQVLELYDLYSENVFKLAYSYTGNRSDAEDVVQDVFLKLLQQNISMNKGKEKSYILKMTANACKDMFRSAVRKACVPFEDALDKEKMYSLSDDEAELLNKVMQLSEKYRMVIHLFYYEGYSVTEISKMLNISVSAVTMRLTRGRGQLKDIIIQEG